MAKKRTPHQQVVKDELDAEVREKRRPPDPKPEGYYVRTGGNGPGTFVRTDAPKE